MRLYFLAFNDSSLSAIEVGTQQLWPICFSVKVLPFDYKIKSVLWIHNYSELNGHIEGVNSHLQDRYSFPQTEQNLIV